MTRSRRQVAIGKSLDSHRLHSAGNAYCDSANPVSRRKRLPFVRSTNPAAILKSGSKSTALLIVQHRLRCGFAQFKLCAHFL